MYFLKLSAPLSSYLHWSDLPPSSILHHFLPLHISSPSSNPLLASPPTRPPTNTRERAHACARPLREPLHLPEPQPTQPPSFLPPPHCVLPSPCEIHISTKPSFYPWCPNWIFLPFLELIHSKKQKKLLPQTNFADESCAGLRGGGGEEEEEERWMSEERGRKETQTKFQQQVTQLSGNTTCVFALSSYFHTFPFGVFLHHQSF